MNACVFGYENVCVCAHVCAVWWKECEGEHFIALFRFGVLLYSHLSLFLFPSVLALLSLSLSQDCEVGLVPSRQTQWDHAGLWGLKTDLEVMRQWLSKGHILCGGRVRRCRWQKVHMFLPAVSCHSWCVWDILLPSWPTGNFVLVNLFLFFHLYSFCVYFFLIGGLIELPSSTSLFYFSLFISCHMHFAHTPTGFWQYCILTVVLKEQHLQFKTMSY